MKPIPKEEESVEKKDFIIVADGGSDLTEEAAQELGVIGVYRFANTAGLKALGNNLYASSEASGDPMEGVPGRDCFGVVESGILESSNVSVVEEMIRLIEAQRAYELNSKAIQTSDAMLATANSLKR